MRSHRRIAQLAIWLAVGPALGLFQGAISFVPVVVMHTPHGEDWHTIALLSLGGLVYGVCWLIPAMVLSDLIFLRRPLLARDLAIYLGVIAGSSAIIGVTIPGYLVMVGVPVTAVAILVVGLVFRTRVGNDPAPAVRYGE
jgi:hypothetical protein